MKHPIWAKALRLADENGRLRLANARLIRKERKQTETIRRLTDERDQARRDGLLLMSMARDQETALGFLETAHWTDTQPEVKR